jgi:antitoxin HigA-1
MMDKNLSVIHPGEILLEDFMKPLGLTEVRLARDLRVTPIRISQIVNGKRSISVDTALRLARYFGTSAAVWLRLQVRYDLEVAQQEVGKRINREVQVRSQPISHSKRRGMSKRDIGQEILNGIQEVKASKVGILHYPPRLNRCPTCLQKQNSDQSSTTDESRHQNHPSNTTWLSELHRPCVELIPEYDPIPLPSPTDNGSCDLQV